MVKSANLVKIMKFKFLLFSFSLGGKTPMTPRRSTRLQSKQEKTPEAYKPRGPRAMMKLNKSKSVPEIIIDTPSKTSKIVPAEQVKVLIS